MAITAAALSAQIPRDVSTEALRSAAAPIEAWMGRSLVIYTGAVTDPPPALRERRFPQPSDPTEALITPNAVYVFLGQLLAFRSGQELAAFLSHAAAHGKLRHPERMAEVMTEVAILNTTHAPEKIASNLEVRTRAEMERDAVAAAAEFMNSSGCTPGACAMFESLLLAAPRP